MAVLASIFLANGSYLSPRPYVQGLVPAVSVGAAVVAISAVLALALPRYVRGMRVAEPEASVAFGDAEGAAA